MQSLKDPLPQMLQGKPATTPDSEGVSSKAYQWEPTCIMASLTLRLEHAAGS